MVARAKFLYATLGEGGGEVINPPDSEQNGFLQPRSINTLNYDTSVCIYYYTVLTAC